ncbi:Methyl-CpG-binding domain-containing protein 11 [Platanthera zijinensis]|uniref:Methyl-CpG-binding domain-containing protein 11 n=1 Tax=Platanthera zijinensis TaxID=2320716 RepID=A0AAP0BJM5_9ASPA
MVRRTEELQAEGDQEAVSVELPAPTGWKKFISKKAGTPKRNEIAFISPTGEEIRYKKQLDRYLRSHPGGPSSSQFDWGHGDTLRRSARLSEKAKEMETSEEEPSKKQGTHLSSKKGTKKKKEGRDSDAEDYSPEAKRPKKREKHSTPKKGIIPKAKSVDAGIRGDEAEKFQFDIEAPESVEDAEMKDAEDVSVEGKGEASSAKAILEDSSAKVDIKDECKHKTVGIIDEVEHSAPVSVKIVAEGIDEAAAKLYSNDGNKQNKNDIDADIEDKAWESENIITQALEILEDSDAKNIAKLDSNDDLDAEMNDGKLEAEQIATQALECTKDSDAKNVDKVCSNDDMDAETKNEGPESENIATEVIKRAVDSDTKLDAEVKNGALESEKMAAEVIKSAADSDMKLDAEVKNEAPEIEKMAAEALKEPLEEDLHKAEEDEDKALLHKNHKGEQVSPSKAIPNAKFRDLKSPEKAAAIV